MARQFTAGGLVRDTPIARFASPELKVRYVKAAIVQLQNQLPAGAFPRLVRLPDVRVLVRSRVVAYAALARRDSFFHGGDRRAVAASDLLRDRVACDEDV